MRHLPLLLLIILLLVAITLVSAQEDDSPGVPFAEGIPLSVYPTHEVKDLWQPVDLVPVDQPLLPASPLSDPAADICVNAPELNLPGGGQTVTNFMTRSPDDPILSCMWGIPPDPRGFRTAWYKYIPEESGYLKVSTSGSNYDTVVAVYSSDLENACIGLEQIGCNDDRSFLASEVNVLLLSGKTYYIEIADWHFEAPGQAILNFAASFLPVNNWQLISSLTPPRSRHTVIMSGGKAYIIGGQTVDQTGPLRINLTQSYDIVTGAWQDLAQMCLQGQPCTTGYSNTTAALISNKIYLPSGFVGNVDEYDGTHWVYDITTNSWSTANNNLWDPPLKPPTIYGTAVPETNIALPRYYYIGGLSGPMPLEGDVNDDDWAPSADVQVYLPQFDRWFEIHPDMPTGRFGHMAAFQRLKDGGGSIQNYICVVGGLGKSETGGPILITDGTCLNSTGSGGWDKNLPQLNHPRYFAGSEVDSEGNWYVFGGTDNEGNSIPSVEVYDKFNNQWVLLDGRFNLGTTVPPIRPARAWPRGGFVGQDLFSFGGHRNEQNGDKVLNLVERITIPPFINFTPSSSSYMPLIFKQDSSTSRNNTFAAATPIPLNQIINSGFVDGTDIADIFYVNIPYAQSVIANLRKVPSGADYDLYIYNSNKGLLGASMRPGNNDESISLIVPAGRLFIVVERKLPAPGVPPIDKSYELLVQG